MNTENSVQYLNAASVKLTGRGIKFSGSSLLRNGALFSPNYNAERKKRIFLSLWVKI